MPMRATTVRFPDALWDLLEGEAGEDGVSAAQFVRDATVMRIAYSMGRRGDTRLGAALAAVRSADTVADRPEPPPLAAVAADRERVAALRATGLLDHPPDEGFERLTRLASELLNAPVALVSLVDVNRQFFLSCRGLAEPWASQRETPLSHSFCQHAVAAGEVLAVDDAREHPLLRDNLAIRDLGVIAYLGAPIFDDAGHALGTLCVIDSRPRQWSSHQAGLLEDLAGAVRSEIVLHAA
jgi:hypothetical protein